MKHTEEAKKKISQNNARYWLGKKRPSPSLETRIKMSNSLKGHKGAIHTEELKKRLSDNKQDDMLKEKGLSVLRFWEHEILSPHFSMNIISDYYKTNV